MIHLNLTRTLTFVINGLETTGELQISRIEFYPKLQKWACYWSLSFIHPEESRIFGNDPLGALFQCLDFIGNLIRGSERDGLDVWWKVPGDHCGLMFTEYPEVPGHGSVGS
jgi:hypothetical protein